jgi:3-dehydroquinate synthase
VAIGIALDSTYSYLSGFLPEGSWRRIIDLLAALGLPVYSPVLGERLETPEDPSCVLRGLPEFQEHLGGRLTIMLLKGIGDPFDVNEIRPDVMVRSIDVLKTCDAGRSDRSAKKAS